MLLLLLDLEQHLLSPNGRQVGRDLLGGVGDWVRVNLLSFALSQNGRQDGVVGWLVGLGWTWRIGEGGGLCKGEGLVGGWLVWSGWSGVVTSYRDWVGGEDMVSGSWGGGG